MSLRLVLKPEVEAEVAAAEAWYRERSLITSERFLRAVKGSLLLIAENPLQYQTVFGRYRKAMVRHFRMR